MAVQDPDDSHSALTLCITRAPHSNEHREMAKMLIAAGANLNYVRPVSDVSLYCHVTAWHLAVACEGACVGGMWGAVMYGM